ncbi:MAG: hypothetical protein JWP11_3723 [Frankiales bacterium]|nr:hypothetical protein [Frankiales bacterium]
MGLTRKIMSMSTLGAVDFRSDKERTAAYTRATRNEQRKQTSIMRKQAKGARPQQWPNGWGPQQPPALPVSAPGRPPAAPNVAEDLERLAALRERGVLTEGEFQVAKSRLLS